MAGYNWDRVRIENQNRNYRDQKLGDFLDGYHPLEKVPSKGNYIPRKKRIKSKSKSNFIT